MYSCLSYNQQAISSCRSTDDGTTKSCNDKNYSHSDYIKANLRSGNYDSMIRIQPNSAFSEIGTNSSAINYHHDLKLGTKSISMLLEGLLNITANKSLPNLEEVQTCKAKLNCHPKVASLFSVLSDLKEGNSNMKIFVGGYMEETIGKLRSMKYANLAESKGLTQCENQMIRLDNMLTAEGIIKREEDKSSEHKVMPNESHLVDEGHADYRTKLIQIRSIYNQEQTKINEELNIFPRHVSNILRQQSEIRPITYREIDLMQNIVNKKYLVLHVHLKQRTCEAIMVLKARCLDARRKRRNFSKKASEILNEFFLANVKHPYPSEEDKQELAKKCGITVSQVCNWFGNKRIRYKKNICKEQKEIGYICEGKRDNDTTCTPSVQINFSQTYSEPNSTIPTNYHQYYSLM